jgi:hypothetical protein
MPPSGDELPPSNPSGPSGVCTLPTFPTHLRFEPPSLGWALLARPICGLALPAVRTLRPHNRVDDAHQDEAKKEDSPTTGPRRNAGVERIAGGWPAGGAGYHDVVRFMHRLAAAVVTGVAAIFVPKPEPDQHWSEIPTVEVDDAVNEEAPSGP